MANKRKKNTHTNHLLQCCVYEWNIRMLKNQKCAREKYLCTLTDQMIEAKTETDKKVEKNGNNWRRTEEEPNTNRSINKFLH